MQARPHWWDETRQTWVQYTKRNPAPPGAKESNKLVNVPRNPLDISIYHIEDMFLDRNRNGETLYKNKGQRERVLEAMKRITEEVANL